MKQICADLRAESDDIESFLVGLDAEGWMTPTPALGWNVRDQVSHLAHFDEKAILAVNDPESFAAELAVIMQATDPNAFVEDQIETTRHISGAKTFERWRQARTTLIDTYRLLDRKTRVLWYGPPMSAMSKITARLMETWAHGQDIVDALGCDRPVTSRIRHVCHIGVRARAFAYTVNASPAPEDDIHVVLEGPSGEVWEWGDADCGQRVEGPAIDFALLATQRRHRADTSLIAVGSDADRWLDIVQAFAGGPGGGREPGQFD